MLGVCVFRVSSLLGFSGVADCCQQSSIFWVVSCQGLVIQVFKLSRVQWCRRLLCAIYSCLCGFMSRVVFLGFQAFQSSVVQEIVVHNLQFFVWFHVGGLCF
jgi:hypothetical protein